MAMVIGGHALGHVFRLGSVVGVTADIKGRQLVKQDEHG